MRRRRRVRKKRTHLQCCLVVIMVMFGVVLTMLSSRVPGTRTQHSGASSSSSPILAALTKVATKRTDAAAQPGPFVHLRSSAQRTLPKALLDQDRPRPQAIARRRSRSNSPTEKLRRGQLDESILAVVVFPTTVDPSRHQERVSAICRSWGAHHAWVNTNTSSLWQLRFYFVSPHQDNNEAESVESSGDPFRHSSTCQHLPHVAALVPPRQLPPTEELAWALHAARSDAQSRLGATAPVWLFKADTITFVVVENLLGLLDTHRRGWPALVLGRRLATRDGQVFLSGGAGFAISPAAADAIHAGWATTGSCRALVSTDPFLRDNADVGLAACVQAAAGRSALAVSSRDGTGRQRFHAFGVVRTLLAAFDTWFVEYAEAVGEGVGNAVGPDACCAAYSVTWHYVEAPMAVFLDGVLHSREHWAGLSASARAKAWPASRLGAPPVDNPELGQLDAAWAFLLNTLHLAGFLPMLVLNDEAMAEDGFDSYFD